MDIFYRLRETRCVVVIIDQELLITFKLLYSLSGLQIPQTTPAKDNREDILSLCPVISFVSHLIEDLSSI